MHPRQMLSCYPPQSLSPIIQNSGVDTLHVYVDLKNVMTSLFVPEVVQEIVTKSQTMKTADSSIFQSCIDYISYWKTQAYHRGLKVKLFFSTDVGRSVYHRNINKGYKKNREIDPLKCAPSEIVIKEVRDKNFKLSEHVCNKLPDVYFFCLEHLESDFIPYHIITRYYKNQNNILHIICSNDKDLYQTLLIPNTVQIYKIKGVRNLLTRESILFSFVKPGNSSSKNIAKKSRQISELDPNWITIMMAFCGDSSDDIPGVDNIGPSTALDLLDKKDIVSKILGTPEQVINRVSEGGKVFLEDVISVAQFPSNTWRKVFTKNDLITDALKQISFELLSRWMEKRDTTTKIDYIKYIEKILSKQGPVIQTPQVFFNSMGFLEDNVMTENTINGLFLSR